MFTSFRNVGNYLDNDTSQHPRCLESSATPLREPKILLQGLRKGKVSVTPGIEQKLEFQKIPVAKSF